MNDLPDHIFVVGFHRSYQEWLGKQPDEVRQRAVFVRELSRCQGYRGTAHMVTLYGYDISIAVDVERQVAIMNRELRKCKLRNLAKAAKFPGLAGEIRWVAASLEELLPKLEQARDAARQEVIDELMANIDHGLGNARAVMEYSSDEGRARELASMTLKCLLPTIKMKDKASNG